MQIPIQASNREIKRGNANFCSLSCVAIHFNKQKAKDREKSCICQQCNKPFITYANTAKFCSLKCKNRYQIIRRKRKYPINSSKCEICQWDKCTCDIHHIIKISENGSNESINLISLCPNCHRMVHQDMIDQNILKLTIKNRSKSLI